MCTDTNEDKIERIFSINEFSDLVKSMVWHYPYIHSVYLYLDGGDVLCATNVNLTTLSQSPPSFTEICANSAAVTLSLMCCTVS